MKTQTEYEERDAIRRQAEERKRANEEAARPCIAGDIPRMESLAFKVKAAVLPDVPLEEVRAAVGLTLGKVGDIEIPDDDIKERVLITTIPTQCRSDFHFLVNVREGRDKKIRWLRVSAENAPAGYHPKLQSELGREFEAEREQQRIQAAQKKNEEEFRAHFAELNESRQDLLQSVKVSDVRSLCDTKSCATRTLEFKITNVSKRPVVDVSFGWMFLPSKFAECPSELATNERGIGLVLQPGQTEKKTIYVFNAPETREARLCLKVTNLRRPYSWER
ncbi:hypothetical protein I6F33_29075 [Bradyrhizobium sp. BRP20]|uniref:hypothetical protein n=1 Tax=Bradyrhizobium sp. BRP20 TaxID=2793822 RepID=UPI001CD2189D|nr:hypothetical protein [Bradyrhizobium sp. BRP20]MCA1437005.1 hypothetical protein [Bradyrhizobium sp. BRP20]